MPGMPEILCLLFVPPFFTVFWLRSAVHHLYSLGRSKTRKRKEQKMIPFHKKVFLIGYAELCKYRTQTAKTFCYIYWGYLLVFLVCIIIWLLMLFGLELEEMLSKCVLVKLFVLDIPVNLYSFIMTKHDKKYGGSTWRWTDEK